VVDLLKHALAGFFNLVRLLKYLGVFFILGVVPLFFFLWPSVVFDDLDPKEACWHVVIEVGDTLLLLANRADYHVVVSLCYVNQALLAELGTVTRKDLGHFELVRQVELLQADITAKEFFHCYSL